MRNHPSQAPTPHTVLGKIDWVEVEEQNLHLHPKLFQSVFANEIRHDNLFGATVCMSFPFSFCFLSHRTLKLSIFFHMAKEMQTEVEPLQYLYRF